MVPMVAVHLGRAGAFFLNACHIGILSSERGGWRRSVACFQCLFILYDWLVLPVTRSHLTLYLNLLLVVQMMRAATSPRLGAHLWHSATFVMAHTLFLNYCHLLYVVGNGSLAVGFDIVDRVQWMGGNATNYPTVAGSPVEHLRSIEMACEASFILHCIPLLIVHRDLSAHRASLAVAYSTAMFGPGRGLTATSRMGTHAWCCLSSFVVPLVYQIYLLLVYESTEAGLWTLYRVPEAVCAGLVNGGLAMNLIVAIGLYLYLLRYLQPAAALAATASGDKKKRK